MAYVYATGYEDPDNVWEDPEGALGYDLLTTAACKDLPPDTWSGFFVWVFPLTFTVRFDYLYSVGGGASRFDLDGYDGTAWANLAESDVADILHPGQKSMREKPLTKVRIRVKHYSTASKDVYVHACRLHPGCGGLLAPICAILHAIGDWFTVLAEAIVDVMFVGDSLSAPFYELAETWHEMGDTCCTVSAALQEILDLLEGGITWEEIETFVRGLLPELPDWLDDPVAYITEIVQGLLPDLPDWLDDPIAYLTEIIQGLIPDLPGWFEDAASWLATMFLNHFPVLYYLAVDPEGEVRYLIGQWFGWEPYQVSSWDLIFKAIMETWFLTLWELYLDPEGWIEENVTDVIEKFLEPLREALGALRGQLEGILSLLFFPGKYVWDDFFGWVDTVQERGDQLMSMGFMVDLEASQAEVEEMLPQIEETWKEIETEMFQEDEVYLPLIEKVWE